MNAEQIAAVQSTFEKVHPLSDTTAEMFYNRLFELDPSVQSLFKGDMKEQGRKLMYMISPPYTFFLLNGDMELHRNRQLFV
jgi:hemoglobin-like flavoprotein